MDFIDWRELNPKKVTIKSEPPRPVRNHIYRSKVEERIRQAQSRGDFDNLEGAGKPLNLEDNFYAGDKAVAYRLLKQNGFAPHEIELSKEIRSEIEKVQQRLQRLDHRARRLRFRRIPVFGSEKRAFNAEVLAVREKYEEKLRELNRKVLTMNLMVPGVMQADLFPVEKMLREFDQRFPLYRIER